MQFLIDTPNGRVLYKPSPWGTHSREDLKYAFKSLRSRGAGAGDILLSSLYRELYPKMFEKYHQPYRNYLKAHGW